MVHQVSIRPANASLRTGICSARVGLSLVVRLRSLPECPHVPRAHRMGAACGGMDLDGSHFHLTPLISSEPNPTTMLKTKDEQDRRRPINVRAQLIALENQAPYSEIQCYSERFNRILADHPALRLAMMQEQPATEESAGLANSDQHELEPTLGNSVALPNEGDTIEIDGRLRIAMRG